MQAKRSARSGSSPPSTRRYGPRRKRRRRLMPFGSGRYELPVATDVCKRRAPPEVDPVRHPPEGMAHGGKHAELEELHDAVVRFQVSAGRGVTAPARASEYADSRRRRCIPCRRSAPPWAPLFKVDLPILLPFSVSGYNIHPNGEADEALLRGAGAGIERVGAPPDRRARASGGTHRAQRSYEIPA